MRRREFIAGLGSAAAWPVAARAQQPATVVRIGWMSRGNATANDPNMNAFRQGMRELGYIEGRSFVIEPAYADGKTVLMPDQAAELERSGVDVIIAAPFEACRPPSKAPATSP
jgi:putative ABC transport system substrate-binding protein